MRSFLPLLLPLLAACPTDPCERVNGAPRVELGTGWETFTPIAEDDRLYLDYGIQGGAHVYGSLRASGLYLGVGKRDWTERVPEVDILLVDDLSEVWGGFEAYELAFIGSRPDRGERLGELVQLWVDPWEFTERETWMEAEVRDICGEVATDRRRVVVAAPE